MIYRSMAHLPIMGPKRRRTVPKAPKPLKSFPIIDEQGRGIGFVGNMGSYMGAWETLPGTWNTPHRKPDK